MYKHFYIEWIGEASALTGTVTDNSGAVVPGRSIRSNPTGIGSGWRRRRGVLGLAKDLV